MNKLVFILFLGLLGCSVNDDMRGVHYDYLLNDGNSKVWMIDQMIVGNTNISAQQDQQKELLIFFQNGRFQYIPLKSLGHKKGRVGSYSVDSEEKELRMYFNKDIWHFTLTEISEDSIYLEPLPDSKAQFSVELVPLKEIFFE